MLNLIFFTTNKTKLAHARYLAEDYPVTIEGFRQMTYHASYDEPRISSREELLQGSYDSALKQAKKAKIDPSRHFFFLEDTSVVIHALSTSGVEVPGVDVKYWMDAQTFDSLDGLLKEKGNNRKTTVRSDILLHIPETYRNKWGLKKACVVFTGLQDGMVAAKEYSVTTNQIFPWLDNKTFNKWFVPDDATLPISLLGITEANKYDFRRHAFLQMITFLKDRNAFEEGHRQISLSLDIVPTLIVCGFTCAGKTTISRYLINKYGYMHIEASDFMYLNFYLRHDVSSDIKIADFAETALREKPNIAAEKIAKYMGDGGHLPTIISGFRSRKEIDWLKNHFQGRKQFYVFFIGASENTRFERRNKRNREQKQMTFEQFRTGDEQQVRMGLNDIAHDINVHTIENEQGFHEFYEAFEESLPQKPKPLQSTEIELSRFKNFADYLRLEDAITIALLSKWEDSEDRKYYTTTAIAKLINVIFPQLRPPKHKDNVSRYFNQDFYAFYDIEPNADETRRRYRLSNTGFGRAMQVYHASINKIQAVGSESKLPTVDD